MARTFLDDGRIEFRPQVRRPFRSSARSSDQRIEDDLREQLARVGGTAPGTVAVAVAAGTVRLTGSVPSRRIREAIADTAARCAGVRHVDNRLRVRPAAPRRSG